MTNPIKALIKKLPVVRALIAERDRFRLGYRFVPPGHFYSPIPELDEIRRDEAKIFDTVPRTIPGIDLREAEQLRLLETFARMYESIPFRQHKTAGLRYFYDNISYSYSDAIFLHCMLRHLKPKRIIEVGSGYSSAVTLDTNERFLGNSLRATFIEPYPELLYSLLKDGDRKRVEIVPQRLQDADPKRFEALESGDILFIDSTHVSKVDSDVNHIVFKILPILAPGVHIHFHDIFYPFEYPREWIFEGRAWNELYLLRAFLQYNDRFSVVLMNTFLEQFHEPLFQEKMPLCLRNRGGSIWLRKN